LPDEGLKISRVIMIGTKQGGQTIKRLQPPASEQAWIKIRVKSVRACFYQMVDSLFFEDIVDPILKNWRK